ncbi:MAG TPA: hypothetical protein ENN68_04120 [Methanomicrobia archaeon]|nr:hypothetical protein [Methanomicrobia archaeon]
MEIPLQITAILLALVVVSSSSSFIACTNAEVIELQVTPDVVVQGEQLSISGLAAPYEAVWLDTSFVLSIPVSAGTYSREFNDIYFPAGNKSFSVTASGIEDIRLELYPIFGTKFEYPLEGPLQATGGVATISISFPVTIEGVTINIAGEKDVLVYGRAVAGATSVTVESAMSISVTADSEGHFALNLSTTGVPVGDYQVSADGFLKTVQVIAPPALFDTGSGTYPSVSGVHTGSITPSTTVTVSSLYTYPCPGTGGHSEYAAFTYPNGTAIAEAYWDGYVGDWQTLAFNRSFSLYANETYHYTIHTGSYPQIIHARSFNATGGVITCTEFVTASGTVYYDWIPALSLIGTNTQS